MGFTKKLTKAIKNPSKTVEGLGRKLDTAAGKKFFGNTVGFKLNLKGRKKSANSEFAKNEYLYLGQPFDKSLIKTIRERFSEIIEDDRYSVDHSIFEGKSYQRHIKRPNSSIPEIRKILTDELILKVEEYYSGYFTVNRVEAISNYSVPDAVVKQTELLSSHWHCDYKRTDYTKLFINLSDVTEDDGPFHIISRARTKELMLLGYKTRNDYHVQIDEFEDKQYILKGIGPIGTAYLANTELCLHRAGVPQIGHTRDTLQLRFVKSDKPIRPDWINHVENFESQHKKELMLNGIND